LVSKDYREQILDSCLQEALSGQSPPDLSARILQTLAATGHTVRPQTPPQVVPVQPSSVVGSNGSHGVPRQKMRNRPIPIVAVSQPAQPTPLGLASAAQRRRQRDRSWYKAVSGIAVAAAVVLIAVGIVVIKSRFATDVPDLQIASRPAPVPAPTNPNDSPSANAGSLAQAPGGSERQGRTPEPQAPKPRTAAVAESSADGFGETVVPFGQPRTIPTDSPSESSQQRIVAQAAPRPDAEIVADINRLVRQMWDEHSAQPSESATDAEWCRRAYLRLVGRIPTVSELELFTSSGNLDKRDKLLDQLLASREFSENWASIFTNILIGRTGGTGEGELATRDGLRQYLETALVNGKPYNEIVYELLAAEGSNSAGSDDYNGAVNFLLSVHDAQGTLATARACQALLGRQIRCVQCHDHPTDDGWRQRDFWAMNAFFRQMHVQRDPQTGASRLVDIDFKGEGTGDLAEAEIYYEDLSGYQRAAYPAFPGAPEISKSGAVAESSRRRVLAELVASSDGLSRALTNRVWAQFFGFGFTRPIDDMGPHNPPTHPELVELMAEQFAAHQYDLRALVRWVAASEPFGLSSRTRADQLADLPEAGGTPLFSRYYTRRLEPEEVYNSLLVAARTPGRESAGLLQNPQEWLGQFAQNMDTDEGNERVAFSGDLRQSLAMMNGPLMRQVTGTAEGTVLRRVIDSQMSAAEKVEHLFLASVARKPTKKELDVSLKMIASRDKPAAALQDIWWALLNSSEFILDH
jgi:hypothetical protein